MLPLLCLSLVFVPRLPSFHPWPSSPSLSIQMLLRHPLPLETVFLPFAHLDSGSLLLTKVLLLVALSTEQEHHLEMLSHPTCTETAAVFEQPSFLSLSWWE